MREHPSPLGLRRSFGFGDRLGLATPGHVEAVRRTSFAPVFAQQSIREMTRTQRTPEEVMASAVAGIRKAGWEGEWGADADHLQRVEDAEACARAGFCFFTIDPSEYVTSGADHCSRVALDGALRAATEKGASDYGEMRDLYLGRSFELASNAVAFSDEAVLKRAVAKYGAALAFAERMAQAIDKACAGTQYDLEVSVDETESPTSPSEHLFIALELKRRGIRVTSLAPRFVGRFEKGVDYIGDLEAFEEHYRLHADIAREMGPYKISIHSGSDKFSIYPIIGRLSGDLLHVKTAGTSYLEALRVVCRTNVPLFLEIAAFCRSRYDADRATYHVSATLDQAPERVAADRLESVYLESVAGREILHVTFGSVLTQGLSGNGSPFKERLLDELEQHEDTYREVLALHLGKHLRLLET